MYIAIWFYFCFWTVQNYIFNLKTIDSIDSVGYCSFSDLIIEQEISCQTNSPEIARNCTMMKVRELHDMAHIFTMIKIRESISLSNFSINGSILDMLLLILNIRKAIFRSRHVVTIIWRWCYVNIILRIYNIMNLILPYIQ